jgi:hypothetical protein
LASVQVLEKAEHRRKIVIARPLRLEVNLLINLKTAKPHGIEMPPTLPSRADEVIE